MSSTQLHLVARPRALPPPPPTGRVVVLDLAFALERDFERVTWPYVRALGARLALWVDHHDHPAWREVADDQRFLLVGKLQARACPQLITPQVVQRVGDVQHVVAHADFDGCMAAAKFLRGGLAPYPEADEDARFADAPGHGFSCSPRGLHILKALDQCQAVASPAQALALAAAVVDAWVSGHTPAALQAQLDDLTEQYQNRAARLDAWLAGAVTPAHGCLLVQVPQGTRGPDKKYLLRQLEARARVGMLWDGVWLTLATFDDAADDGLDLSMLPGLKGQRGYAWGKVSVRATLPALAAALRGR